jgi:hypothetical protein
MNVLDGQSAADGSLGQLVTAFALSDCRDIGGIGGVCIRQRCIDHFGGNVFPRRRTFLDYIGQVVECLVSIFADGYKKGRARSMWSSSPSPGVFSRFRAQSLTPALRQIGLSKLLKQSSRQRGSEPGTAKIDCGRD